MVTAELEGVHSQVYASSLTPSVSDGVEIILTYFSTLTCYSSWDFSFQSNTLKVDYIIRGFTSEAESFLLRVRDAILTSEFEVILDVEEVRLEDVFDLEVSFAETRPEQIPLSIESRARHRHLIGRMNHRRLGFLGDIFNGIKQGIREAVTFIADAIVGVMNEFIDAVNALLKGKLEESIKIMILMKALTGRI